MLIYLAFIDEQKDKDLFVSVYEQYREPLLRYAIRYMGEYSAHAEDALQEAFIAVAKNIKTVQRIECNKRGAFFVTIVKNKAIDIIRRESQRPAADMDEAQELPDGGEAPLERLVTEEGFAELRGCIARLPDSYRTVLELRLLHGLGDAEIAALLDITPKNAAVRACRGKLKLREMLRGREG